MVFFDCLCLIASPRPLSKLPLNHHRYSFNCEKSCSVFPVFVLFPSSHREIVGRRSKVNSAFVFVYYYLSDFKPGRCCLLVSWNEERQKAACTLQPSLSSDSQLFLGMTTMQRKRERRN